MDDANQPRKRKPSRAEYMRAYRARKQGKAKSAKAEGKAKTGKKTQAAKDRGAAAIRANDKTPFEYDAKPIIERHLGPGRPTGYHPFLGDELVALMAEGLCISAAAGALGFCYETYREWGHRYPEFGAALKHGRAVMTLYQNRKLNASIDGPSVTGAIFALKSICPEEWRDRQEVARPTPADDPLLAFLRSINGRVLRPREPDPEPEMIDITPEPVVEEPPRPIERMKR